MSSTVCQTLHSVLDPLLFEPRRSPHTPSFPRPHQPTLTEQSSEKTEQIYVHPLVLTTKSLEMCTESLGSETGNDIVPGFDEFSRHAFEKLSLPESGPAKDRRLFKKVKNVRDFPPPLTSISGEGGVVQVHTHREGGRLVITAFNVSSPRNFFRAERENGRLQLSLVRERERDESFVEDGDGEEGEEEEEGEKEYFDGESGGEESEFDGRYNRGENGGEIMCKINGGDWSGSRCNEERDGRSKRIPSLPFCVAIS